MAERFSIIWIETVKNQERDKMPKRIKAVINSEGKVHLLEPFHSEGDKRALVIILEEDVLYKETDEKKQIFPSWVGKCSSDGNMIDDRNSIYGKNGR